MNTALNYKARRIGFKAGIMFLYLVMVLFFLGPILWVVSISFKTPSELFGAPTLLPKYPTLENFTYIFFNTRMPVYIGNSFLLVLYTVVGTLLIAIPSSYAFSRFKFKNKSFILVFILLFQMISPVVLCIPLFRYFSRLNLLNSYVGLTLVYVAVQIPFATYLLKGVFDSVPQALDESAYIDGASRMQVLLRIILPISRSGISSAVIFISINAWSQFIIPFFFLRRERLYPVAVGILQAQGSYQDISIQYVAAASIVGLLPAVLIVLFLQKFIVSALMAGAIKG
jgi:multiple sugar transport system permease protein